MKNAFMTAVSQDLTKSKKDALTANGAVTRSTSGMLLLDLFAIVGSARKESTEQFVSLFSKAYAADKNAALRILLWARDVRGGAGERQIVRNVIRHLSANDPLVVEKLIPHMAEFGRWDDMIESVPVASHLFKLSAMEVKKAIDAGNALAAKWCPRKGTVAVALRDAWEMTPKQYRKFVVNNTKVVETQMCNKEWKNIEFGKLPSLAGLRYQSAFGRHAPIEYGAYKEKLVKGEVTINASTLFPHNIVQNVMLHSGDTTVLNEQWKSLPNFMDGNKDNVVVMSDVSSSMSINIGGSTTAMMVSIAMGLYISERSEGAFRNLVMTFSAFPSFHLVTGNTITERVLNLSRAGWGGNTDFQAAFKLVLDTAKKNKVPENEMPKVFIVVSDMEFDRAGVKTNFGAIKKQYKEAGYEMPNLVFWNVNAKVGNNPVKYDADGTCMISGFSPAILTSVLSGKEYDPMAIMNKTIMVERYDVVDEILAT